MKLRVTMVLGVLLAAVCGPALWADEATAKFFADRGRKAYKEKKLPEAKEFFDKALDEERNYLPALLGRARVAIGETENPTALTYLTACMRRGAIPKLSADESKAAKEADTVFAEFDAPGHEFTKLLASFERDLIDAAEKHAGKDPNFARLCLEKVLSISPELKEVRDRFEGLGFASELAQNDTHLELFNGSDLKDWTAEPTIWTVEGGKIVGRAERAFTANHKDKVTGDFVIDCELRIPRDTGEIPLCGVLFGWVGYGDFYSLKIQKGHFLFCVRNAKNSTTLVQKDWVDDWAGFDHREWNRYTLKVKGDTVTVFVNGRELLKYTVTKDRPTDGYVGLHLQMQNIEVRRYDLLR
ncbi:MAG: DUF1080 domain-containing protein [Planctomycetota bacterium]